VPCLGGEVGFIFKFPGSLSSFMMGGSLCSFPMGPTHVDFSPSPHNQKNIQLVTSPNLDDTPWDIKSKPPLATWDDSFSRFWN